MPFTNLHHGNAQVKRERNVTRQMKRELNIGNKSLITKTSNLAPDLNTVEVFV